MGPLGASQPVISPFFADVDSVFVGGVMYLRTDIPNEIIVTWDGVAYFNEAGNQLDSFQLVLRGPNFVIPPGEGQIGFFYKTMQWEVGNAGGATGGFCNGAPGPTCFPASIGFGDGVGDGFVLQGSNANGIAAIVNNHHIWFNLTAGVPAPVVPPIPPVPPPGTLWLFGLGLAFLGFWHLRARKVASKIKV